MSFCVTCEPPVAPDRPLCADCAAEEGLSPQPEAAPPTAAPAQAKPVEPAPTSSPTEPPTERAPANLKPRGLSRRRVAGWVAAFAGVFGVGVAFPPPELPRRPTHGAAGGPLQHTRAGYAVCVERLWGLSRAIRDQRFGPQRRAPASLSATGVPASVLRCPATGRPLVYVRAPDEITYYAACPDPERHGVSAIEVGPERVAPVVAP